MRFKVLYPGMFTQRWLNEVKEILRPAVVHYTETRDETTWELDDASKVVQLLWHVVRTLGTPDVMKDFTVITDEQGKAELVQAWSQLLESVFTVRVDRKATIFDEVAAEHIINTFVSQEETKE